MFKIIRTKKYKQLLVQNSVKDHKIEILERENARYLKCLNKIIDLAPPPPNLCQDNNPVINAVIGVLFLFMKGSSKEEIIILCKKHNIPMKNER